MKDETLYNIVLIPLDPKQGDKSYIADEGLGGIMGTCPESRHARPFFAAEAKRFLNRCRDLNNTTIRYEMELR